MENPHPQAENDHHIRDTYNYVTVQVRARAEHQGTPAHAARTAWLAGRQAGRQAVTVSSELPSVTPCRPQTDVRMPKRHILQLEDAYVVSRFQQAIEAAVRVGGPAGRPRRWQRHRAPAGARPQPAFREGRTRCGAVSDMGLAMVTGHPGARMLVRRSQQVPGDQETRQAASPSLLCRPAGGCCRGQGLPRAQLGGGGGAARHAGAARWGAPRHRRGALALPGPGLQGVHAGQRGGGGGAGAGAFDKKLGQWRECSYSRTSPAGFSRRAAQALPGTWL